jgi:hypothetical protein
MISVKLYLKAGCHLCEEAEAILEHLRPRYPHSLERVDIRSDPELCRQYGELIPVLVVDGVEYSAPLSRATIEQAFQRATQVADDPRPSAATQAQTAVDDQSRPNSQRAPWSNTGGR